MSNPQITTPPVRLNTSNSNHAQMGPYKDPNTGYLYVCGPDQSAISPVSVYRSTDSGVTWSLVQTMTGDNVVTPHFDSLVDWSQGTSGTIWMLTSGSTSIELFSFDIASQTITANAYGTGTNPAFNSSVRNNGYMAFAKRSDNSIVVFYDSNTTAAAMGTPYWVVSYVTWTSGGGWGTENVISAGGVGDYRISDCVLGSSDRVHFIYSEYTASPPGLIHRSLSSAGVLDTAQTLETGLGTSYQTARIFYDSASSKIFIGNTGSGTMKFYRGTSGATPTLTADTNTVFPGNYQYAWNYDNASTTITVVGQETLSGYLVAKKLTSPTGTWSAGDDVVAADLDVGRGSTNLQAQLGSTTNTNGRDKAVAFQFAPSANVTLDEIGVRIGRSTTGALTGNMLADLCADDAGGTQPGTVLATSNTNSIAEWTDTNAHWKTFVFASPYSLVNGTNYWMVFRRDSTTVESVYVVVYGSSTSGGTAATQATNGTWTSQAYIGSFAHPSPAAANWGVDGLALGTTGMAGTYSDKDTRYWILLNPQTYTKTGIGISVRTGHGFTNKQNKHAIGIAPFIGGGTRVGGAAINVKTGGASSTSMAHVGGGKSKAVGWTTVTGGTAHSVAGSSGDSAISMSVSLGSIQADDLIVVIARSSAQDANEGMDSCTDTLGNVYHKLGARNYGAPGYFGFTTWYAVANQNGNPTITNSYAYYPVGTPPHTRESRIDRAIAVQAFRPKKGIPVLDIGGSGGCATSTAASGNAPGVSITPSNGGCLFVGTAGAGTNNGALTATSGWTRDQYVNDAGTNFIPIGIFHQTQGTAAALACDVTFGGGGAGTSGFGVFNGTFAFAAYDSTDYFTKTGGAKIGGRSRRKLERIATDDFDDLTAWATTNVGTGTAVASNSQVVLNLQATSDSTMIVDNTARNFNGTGMSVEIDLVSLDVGATLAFGWAVTPTSTRPGPEISITHDTTGTGWHINSTVNTTTQTVDIAQLPNKLRAIYNGSACSVEYGFDYLGQIMFDPIYSVASSEAVTSVKPYLRATSSTTGSVNVVVDKLMRTQNYGGDWYGFGAAISNDGKVVAISAPNYHGGAGKVFIYSGPNWSTETIIDADSELGNSSGEDFGIFIALSGDGKTLAVFPGDAFFQHMYVYNGANWGTKTRVSTGTGDSSNGIAISDDGSVIAVGYPFTTSGGFSSAGLIKVFSGASWGTITTLTASDQAANANLSWSIAVSGDGSTVVAGARGATVSALAGAGAVYIYNGASWGTETKISEPSPVANNNFGYAVATDRTATNVVVGVGNITTTVATVSNAYVFFGGSYASNLVLPRKQLSVHGAAESQAYDSYGQAVAISSDGSVIVVGAPDFNTAPMQGGQEIQAWLASPDNVNTLDSDKLSHDFAGSGAAFSYTGASWATETIHHSADIGYPSTSYPAANSEQDRIGFQVAISDTGVLLASAYQGEVRSNADHESGFVLMDVVPGASGFGGSGTETVTAFTGIEYDKTGTGIIGP